MPLKIAIAGLGTVGSATVRLLQREADLLRDRCGRPLEIVAVSARDRGKDRGVDLSAYPWEDNPVALADRSDVDVIVELLGGSEGAARELVTRALANGKSVVTANKALLATHGVELAGQAEDQRAMLAFEAAVAGAMPVVESIRRGLAANPVKKVAGILNGTCNFILTEMERTGASFEEVLREAQARGYAEADPSFDVDGIDTAHKLTVLASIAFRIRPDLSRVTSEGIRRITPADIAFARECGYRIKLLGVASRQGEGVSLRVAPALVSLAEPMAQVSAAFNAVAIEGAYSGKLFMEGLGAGGDATASAVVSDLIAVARRLIDGQAEGVPAFGVQAADLQTLPKVPANREQARYYLRFRVLDLPGVLARIAEAFASAGVSLHSVLQRSAAPDQPVDIVLMTHTSAAQSVQQACEQLASAGFCQEPPLMIRIEE